jgi:hypothetical protein
MANIDRPGSFRGNIIDRGVGQTKNLYPQLILQLQATEKWDEENSVWVEWPYEEVEATAYMCLFGGNGKATLGVQQAMKALNWDGSSLMALQEDTSVEQIQWRMENNTYEGTTRLQVAWIDAYDAEPGRKVRKLDAADIKKLDAKYAAALKAIGGGPKPKSAKPAAPKAAPAPAEEPRAPQPGAPEDPTPAAAALTEESAPAAADAPTESPVPTDPPKPPKPPRAKTKAKPVAQVEAWAAVYQAGKAAGKDDKTIIATWTAQVNEAGGDEKVGDDWSGIQASVLAALAA